jgi:hypothetical protein
LKRTILVAILLGLVLGRCFSRPGKIELVSETEPLTVKVHGHSEPVDWIWFQGPYRNLNEQGPAPPPSERDLDVIVWKIRPAGNGEYYEFAQPGTIPAITYGVVPEGWEQELPKTGMAPPLLNGFVYTVGVVTARGPRPNSLCVYVNNGRLQLYGNKKDPPCDQD